MKIKAEQNQTPEAEQNTVETLATETSDGDSIQKETTKSENILVSDNNLSDMTVSSDGMSTPDTDTAFAVSDENSSEKDESEEVSEEMIAQLQAKANQHNEQIAQTYYEEDMPPVWEGDPGNGIDFIPIVDLPIEDQSALPDYDMLDNPTMPIQAPVQPISNIPILSIKKN